MKMTITMIAVILFGISLAGLSGCAAAPTDKDLTTNTAATIEQTTTEMTTAATTTAAPTTTEATSAQATTTQGSNANDFGRLVTVDDFDITLQNVILTKDLNGKEAITVIFDWTNNSDQTIAPMDTVYFVGFQDGTELKSAFVLDENNSDSYARLLAKAVEPTTLVEGLCYSFLTTESKNDLEFTVFFTQHYNERVFLKVPFPQE